MAEPPEFWMFIASNILLLCAGGALTLLSYLAYRRGENKSLLGGVIGFAIVTIGTLIEVIYELGIRGSYNLDGNELLIIHTVEGVVIAGGLFLIFFSVTRQ